MKTCRRCQQSKPPSEFRADTRNRDGLGSWCVECHRQRASEWAKENRERLNKKQAERRQANPDAARAVDLRYKRKHKAKRAVAHAEWARRNADKRRASTAKRKAAKLRATPAWAKRDAIAAIYADAVSRPGRWHVDHIIPLQGETVSGLHCEANLQVLPGADNEGKRNRWWPDMFEDAQRQGDFFVDAAA
jgi:hypothetical protein